MTPEDILGPPLAADVDRTPVDPAQMSSALFDLGSAIPEVQRRRARYNASFEVISGEAERHLKALAAIYNQVSDQLNAADGMKSAIRSEATLGYGVFSPAYVDELRVALALISDTLQALEARVRSDLVI